MSIEILWTVPPFVQDTPEYDKIRVYRGTSENDIDSYSQIAELDRLLSDSSELTYYIDTESIASRNYFYLIRYLSSSSGKLSRFVLTIFTLSPKEQRLVNSLRQMLDPIVTSFYQVDGEFTPMTDEDLMLGIKLALSWFNNYPPVTGYSLVDFPSGNGTEGSQGYESTLLYAAQVATLLNRYVGLSIRDFDYSDNGLSLNQRFAPAVQQAITQSMALVNQMLGLAKLEFADGGVGLGTVSLPIGIGGNISRGISNLLDIFSSSGR